MGCTWPKGEVEPTIHSTYEAPIITDSNFSYDFNYAKYIQILEERIEAVNEHTESRDDRALNSLSKAIDILRILKNGQ